jgi:ATP phosphoribosyltransferase
VAKAPDGLDDHELLARLADLLRDLVSFGETLRRAA